MKDKTFILIVLLVLLVVIRLNITVAQSETFGEDGNIQWILDDDLVLTISGNGSMRNYYSKRGDDSVYVSTAPWRDKVKKLIIGEGITSIGNYAFYRCYDLTCAIIPQSITSIGNHTFDGCWSLSDIEIPSNVLSMGEYAFSECKFSSISIPEGITVLNKGVFDSCGSMTSIRIPDGVTIIGDSAFSGCHGLTEISIPESVTSIGNYAFRYCRGLKSVFIPNSVRSIGSCAFMECRGLIDVTLPECIENIGAQVFRYCSNLTSVIIPEGVLEVGFYAFGGCESLTEVELPKSISIIGQGAFRDCSSLNSINLESDLTRISYEAFCGCSSLTFVDIPNGIEEIYGYSFSGCNNLLHVKLPTTVLKIGESAFSYCANLSSITIPQNVTSIENYAFSNCKQLKKVFFTGDDTSFVENAFTSKPTVYCYEYSTSEGCAIEQDLPIVLMDSFNPDSERSIKIMSEKERVAIGETIQIKTIVVPDYDDPEIIWSINNPQIANVEDGIFTGMSKGSAIVTVTCGSINASKTIDVYVQARDFIISENEVWIIAKESLQLNCSAIPSDAYATYTWFSSDTEIATVDEKGKILTKKPGEVAISAVSNNGIQHETVLHVCYPVTSIAFETEQATVSLGNTLQLTANVSMRTQSCINQLVCFSSEDESVATVDEQTGVITGMHTGTVVITATADSGVCANCIVSVCGSTIFTLPSSLSIIESEAFVGIPFVDAFRIPDGVTDIADDAFCKGSTIIVSENSIWKQWAIEHELYWLVE